MKKNWNLSNVEVVNLFERFVQIAIDQDKAMGQYDKKKLRLLFEENNAIENELKSRDGDARTELIKLYAYPNMQVRLNAAKATLAVNPTGARDLLVAIQESNWFPQSAHAGMTLFALEQGIFKPT
jgi:hypothetical protein